MAAKFSLVPPPKGQVNYPVAKPLIKSGDLISFFTSHEDTFFHHFTTVPILYFTGARIYHTGIAIWMEDQINHEPRLMCCEAVGAGRRLVNMEKFKDHKFELHVCPDAVDRAKVCEFMLDGLGTPYAFYDLAVIAIQEFFGKQGKASTTKQVCSETAAAAWKAGGFPFENTVYSPGMLRNVLSSMGVPPTLGVNPDAGN